MRILTPNQATYTNNQSGLDISKATLDVAKSTPELPIGTIVINVVVIVVWELEWLDWLKKTDDFFVALLYFLWIFYFSYCFFNLHKYDKIL
jgi:hypothetical protein